MLTPAKIQAISDPIEEVYIHIVDELMVNIGKHLTSPTWTHTAAWEIQKLSEMGQLTQENAEIINKWIKQLPKEVRDAMEETRRLALEKIEKDMEKAVRLGKLPEPLADSTVNVLNEYSQQAIDQLNLVNTVMLQSSVQQYQRGVQLTKEEYDKLMQQQEQTQIILNEAAGSVATGIETREKALRRAITRISDEGLTGFIDRAGHHWSPEAYVNMDIRTTVHNTAIQSVKNFMQDYNTQVFQVSSHAAARPGCYPYQGKFYSWDNSAGEIELGNGNRVRYEPLNVTTYGQPAGLFGINCGHYPIPIVPGVTIPHGADNIQPKEENDKAYAESQEQRALERKIREAKRVVAMEGNLATKEDKARVKELQAEMREFIERTGRTRRYDREQIGGTPQTSRTPTTPEMPVIGTQSAETIRTPAFTPAATIQEAEQFARQFTNAESRYTKIDYSKVDLQYANEFNRAMNDVLSVYAPKYPLREIVPMNKREKAFQGTDADAAYQWGSNKLFFNATYFKSGAAFEKHVQQYRDLLAQVLPNVDNLIEQHKNDTGYLSAKQNAYLRAMKQSGRTNVSEADAYGTFVHEIGHYLDDTVFRSEMRARGFDLHESYQKYSESVSAYATESNQEYVAESFLAFWKGERGNLDPALISIFEDTQK